MATTIYDSILNTDGYDNDYVTIPDDGKRYHVVIASYAAADQEWSYPAYPTITAYFDASALTAEYTYTARLSYSTNCSTAYASFRESIYVVEDCDPGTYAVKCGQSISVEGYIYVVCTDGDALDIYATRGGTNNVSISPASTPLSGPCLALGIVRGFYKSGTILTRRALGGAIGDTTGGIFTYLDANAVVSYDFTATVSSSSAPAVVVWLAAPASDAPDVPLFAFFGGL